MIWQRQRVSTVCLCLATCYIILSLPLMISSDITGHCIFHHSNDHKSSGSTCLWPPEEEIHIRRFPPGNDILCLTHHTFMFPSPRCNYSLSIIFCFTVVCREGVMGNYQVSQYQNVNFVFCQVSAQDQSYSISSFLHLMDFISCRLSPRSHGWDVKIVKERLKRGRDSLVP